MGDEEVVAFLTYLSLKKNVAANTQSNALNALVFLYKEIIDEALSLNLNYIKSGRQQKLPVVLTHLEIENLLKSKSAAETSHQPSVWQWS